MLRAFDLGVLGARLFPSPNWVRAKDAKLAKGLEGGRFFEAVKAITDPSLDHTFTTFTCPGQTHSPPRPVQSHQPSCI